MKNMLRRPIAMLLAMIMILSCVPMEGLAAIVPVNGPTTSSEGISLYSIVRPSDTYTRTYIFMNGETEFARQIIKSGDSLLDPGTPSGTGKFLGWYDGTTQVAFGTQTFAKPEGSTATNKDITCTAKFDNILHVYFVHNGVIVATKEAQANDDGSITVTTNDVTIDVDADQKHEGWLNGTVTVEDSFTTSADVTLTAKVSNGHWITFDSQGGAYVEPLFVTGKTPNTAPTATKPGYTLKGWATTETATAGDFTWGNELTENVTLYAVWTPNTNTQYTVIHWLENANDTNYSYKESETKTGTTGATTAATSKAYSAAAGWQPETNKDYQGFTAQTITQETIKGDGSTIVNVYYKRIEYTITFKLDSESYPCGKTEHTHSRQCYDWGTLTCTREEHTHSTALCGAKVKELTITAKYGANISSQWPTINGSSTWKVNQYSGPYQVSIETMPLGGATFYGPNIDDGSETAYYYVEILPGETVKEPEIKNEVTYKLHHSDTSPGTGYVVTDEDKYPITGFTYKEGTANRSDYNGAKFYYTRNSYNIIYVSGGKTVNTASYKFEQSIATAGNYTPTTKPVGKEDYTFGGWYADPECTKKYVFAADAKMPAENITVYAKWNPPVYTLTVQLRVKVNGQTQNIISEIPTGEDRADALNALQQQIMAVLGDGYEWHGWKKTDGTPFNIYTKIQSDTTISASFSKMGQFSVVYSANTGTGTVPVDGNSYADGAYATVLFGTGMTAPAGKVFLGWNTQADGQGTAYLPGSSFPISANAANKDGEIYLYASWGETPATVSLTYKANGGTGDDVVYNYPNNKTVATIQNPFTRTGYKFVGWATSANATDKEFGENESILIDNTGDSANILYAVWVENEFKLTIKYVYEDGTEAAKEHTATVMVGQGYNVASPTITGYTPDKATVSGTMPAEDVTVTVTYTANSHNVTYEYTGTVPTGAAPTPAPHTETYNTTVTVAATPSLAGYSFNGWKKGEETVTSFTMPDKDVTLQGSWVANTDTPYTIEYYLQDLNDETKYNKNADATEKRTGTTDQMASVQDADKKSFTGFTFDEHNTNNVLEGTITGDGLLVLKLYYTRNTHTVTYTKGDHGVFADDVHSNVKYGASTPAFKSEKGTDGNPKGAAGYTFTGWDKDIAQTVTADATYTAQWTADTNTGYKVEHYQQNLDGKGYTLKDTDNLTGTTDTTATAVAKTYEGFTYDKGNANEVASGKITGDGKLVLKLYYTRNSYNVTYKYENNVTGQSELPTDASYKYGAEVTVAAAATAAGYTFSGWSTTDATIAGGKFTMPAKNVEIKGSWTANGNTEYKVEYYLQDLNDENTYNKNADATVTHTGATNQKAYVQNTDKKSFTGFTFDEHNTNNVLEGTIAGNGSLVLKLYYTRDSYTVTYAYYIGNVPTGASKLPDDATYKYGAEVPVAAPATAGNDYVFSGWSTTDATVVAGKFTMPANNVKLIGSWPYYYVEWYKEDLNGNYPDTPDTRLIRRDTPVNEEAEVRDGSIAGKGNDKFVNGFTLDEENPNTILKKGPVDADGTVTLKLYFTRNSYNVTYEYTGTVHPANEPAVPAGGTYKYQQMVPVADAPTVPGYKFSGWSTTNAFIRDDGMFSMPNGAVTLTGSWEIDASQTVAVTYVAEGHGKVTNASDNIQIVTANGLTGSTATATEGYKFVGWYKGETKISDAATLEVTTAKANLNKDTNNNYADTEFVAKFERDFESNDDDGKFNFVVGSYTGTYDTAKHSVTISGLIVGEDSVSFSTDGGTTWTTAAAWNGTIPADLMQSEVKWNTTPNAGYYYVAGSGVEAVAYPTVSVKASNGNVTKTLTGTITIYPVNLSINIKGAEFTYDGKAHGLSDAEGYTAESFYGITSGALVSGQELSITEPLAKYTPGAGVAVQEKVTQVGTYVGLLAGTISIVDQAKNSTILNYLISTSVNPLVIKGDGIVPEKTLVSSGEGAIKVGSLLTYNITVENVSTTEVTDVKVVDTTAEIIVPQGVTGVTLSTDKHTATIASIASGGKVVLNAQHKVTEQDLVDYAGKDGNGNDKLYKNTANITLGDKTISVSDNGIDLPEPESKLTVTKTTTSKPKDEELGKYKLGERIKYSITVTNDGNQTIDLESITDTLAGASITVVSGTGFLTPGNGTVTFNPARSLNPGESLTVEAEYTVTEADVRAGKVVNGATAAGKDPSGNDPEVTPGTTTDETEEKNSHLTVTKKSTNKGTGENGAFKLGETIEYEITVTNDGNQTIALESITDTLAGAEIPSIEEMDFAVAGGKATFNPAYTLNPGESLTVEAEYIVTEADILVGKVVNGATAAGKDPENKDPEVEDGTTEDNTEEPNASFTLEKTLTNTPAKGYFTAGETAEFSVVVKNNGNVTLTNVTVKEELTGATFTEILENRNNLKVSLGDTVAIIESIAPGQTVTLKAKYTVTVEDLGTELENIVTGKGNGPKPDPENPPIDPEDPEGSAKVPVDNAVIVMITKKWDDQENKFESRPESVSFSLKKTVGMESSNIGKLEATEENGWTAQSDKLPAHTAGGQEITYTLEEETVKGYTGKYTMKPVENPASQDNQNDATQAKTTELQYTFTNTLNKYKLTIRYWKHVVGGEKAFNDYTAEYEYNAPYSVQSPGLYGWEADMERVEGKMPAEDLVVDVVYRQLVFKLTIYYIFEDGTTAHKEYEAKLMAGEKFAVESPEIQGYKPNLWMISGEMPDRDLNYTVIYMAQNTPVDLSAATTPLGIGNVVPNAGDCFD